VAPVAPARKRLWKWRWPNESPSYGFRYVFDLDGGSSRKASSPVPARPAGPEHGTGGYQHRSGCRGSSCSYRGFSPFGRKRRNDGRDRHGIHPRGCRPPVLLLRTDSDHGSGCRPRPERDVVRLHPGEVVMVGFAGRTCKDCGKGICRVSVRCKSCAQKETRKDVPKLAVNVDDEFRGIVEKTRWFLSRGYVFGHPFGRSKPSWKLHQYVWYLAHGGDRVRGLDHMNRDKQDNRLSNLRLATPVLQGHNRTGTPKASYRPASRMRPWRISVRKNGVTTERCFASEPEAVEWATNARQMIIEFESLKATM
jgi:hypothetical protein